MAADDLASIPGMQEKHRRVLSERLGIATNQELADADPQSILVAMRRMKPPPTLDEIKLWQDRARRQRAAAVPASPDWDQAASFVVVFEYRHREAVVEHRLAVEQTEVEPVQPPKIWPDWDCQEICSWMRGLVPSISPEGVAPAAEGGVGRPSDEGEAAVVPEIGGPAPRIERVTFKGEPGEVDLLVADAETLSPIAFSGEARLEIVVGGADPAHETLIAARSMDPRHTRAVVHGPAVVRERGAAEVDLSALPSGETQMCVLVWSPDAHFRPIVVRLRSLTRFAAAADEGAPASRASIPHSELRGDGGSRA